jgi:hypothetical protein
LARLVTFPHEGHQLLNGILKFSQPLRHLVRDYETSLLGIGVDLTGIRT